MLPVASTLLLVWTGLYGDAPCYFAGTEAEPGATSSGRSSTSRRSRSGGTSRQPSEDDRDEAAGNHASPPGGHHPGRHTRRTDSKSGKQMLSPGSFDDEPAQISPLQVINEKRRLLRIIIVTSQNRASVIFAPFGPSACPSACPFVCPTLLVPARLVSHAAAATRAVYSGPQLAACHLCLPRACRARPSVHPSHSRGHTSRQSYHCI